VSEYSLQINGQQHRVDAPPGTPLLWVLREQLSLTGTKFGCGVGQCGACMVSIDGARAPSCLVPIEAAVGRTVLTIEGLSVDGSHPLQRAWVELQVPQCGYCQSGMIMSAVDLLARNPAPSREQIAAHMWNICRCGTYSRIAEAIARAAEELRS
jgi:isoquinoline 1-oxidoreductase alpha subunit